jgi:hypothetical protein
MSTSPDDDGPSRALVWTAAQRAELENMLADFDLIRGEDGRCCLWWRAECLAVCSFPSPDVATRILLGDWRGGGRAPGQTSTPGWCRGTPGINVVAALHRHREANGVFPHVELDDTSSVFDFYVAVDTELARRFLFNLIHDEVVGAGMRIDPVVTGAFVPMIARYLAGACDVDAKTAARVAPAVAGLLIHQCEFATLHQRKE